MNYIRFKKNNLCVESVSALKLARKYETPFYCYSLSQLKNNFNNFSNTFKEVNPIICFSVKSNSNLALLRELKKMGSGADVTSIGELLKAIKAGIKPKKIVFSGVGKTKREIKIAIEKGILLINVESENEAILISVGKMTGVNPFLILSIVGVESNYGRHKGEFTVFNALYTQIAKMPRRSKWAKKEMIEYLLY